MGEEKEPLASELYSDLKQSVKFRERLIYILLGVIVILVLALAGTNVYHIYEWSQFDTIVVDSGTSGNANLVQSDNTGGIINNGENSSSPAEEGQQGNAN